MYCLYGEPRNRSADEIASVSASDFDSLFIVGNPQGDERLELMFQLYKHTADQWGVLLNPQYVRLDGKIVRLELDASKLRDTYRTLGVQRVAIQRGPMYTFQLVLR